MDVRLQYQPYSRSMAIFMDGTPIGMVSSLSRLQTLPFTQWYSEILEMIAYEVNDSFRLTYVGRSCEYRLLQGLLPGNTYCKSMRHEKPPIEDNALVRLKKLSRMVVNGLSCKKRSFEIPVYTDLEPGEVEDMVGGALPPLAFCKLKAVARSIRQCPGTRDGFGIALLSRADESLAGRVDGIVCIGKGIDTCVKETVVLFSEQDEVAFSIKELLELVLWPTLLKETLETVVVPRESPFFAELFVLDKTEPQCVVSLPRSIEMGCSVAVQASTIPRSNYKPQIHCRVSNDTVITYENGYLTAVGTGEAVVEVYEAGKVAPLYKASITAYRRNRIQKIQLQPSSISVCVGESVDLKHSCFPADADNYGALKLQSENGTIVGIVDKNRVMARRPGFCSVSCVADAVESNPCDITVYPRLEKLSLFADKTEVTINTLTKIDAVRTPPDATLDNLKVIIEPKELGSYDVGSGSFFARTPGEGEIIVKSDRNGVEARLPIRVVPERKSLLKPILIGAGILAAIVLIKLLLG